MKRLKKSKRSLKVRNDIGGWILFWIIVFGLVFYLLVAPCAVAYGVITGQLDIETLNPVGVEQSETHPCGGY